MPLCEGRVAVVTGAGQGIGRAHALELARQGASVVVNDLRDPTRPGCSLAAHVAEEIRALGGAALDCAGDVTDWDDAHGLIAAGIEQFGKIDAVVTNAGIIRHGPIHEIDAERWKGVIGSHVFGTAFVTHAAVTHWVDRAHRNGPVDGRLICTTSQSGLFGAPNTVDYDMAKAAVAGFVVAASKELADIGVTVNGVAPRAHTRMSEEAGVPRPTADKEIYERSPDNVSPLVAWLASRDSAQVTGRVITVQFGFIGIIESWRMGPSAESSDRWRAAELGPLVEGLVARAGPNPPFVTYPAPK